MGSQGWHSPQRFTQSFWTFQYIKEERVLQGLGFRVPRELTMKRLVVSINRGDPKCYNPDYGDSQGENPCFWETLNAIYP